MDDRPDIELIGGLDEVASEQQIKKDVKKLNNIFVSLKAKLDFSEVWKQLNKTKFTIPIYFKGKDFYTETKRNLQNAQKIADNNKVKVSYSFEMDKNKFQNQLINFSKENSKLFTSKEMTQKYNQLVDSAYIAKSSSELKGLRKQLSAFRTELIAVNKAGMTWTDKFKASISHFAQYFSGASFIYTVANQLRNAWTEAKTLDDRLVDLQKVTSEIENRDSLYKYFDKALKKANELNVEVGSLIYAITEFKKLGWSLSDAELGGEWATKLSNVGDINIDTAIGSIKTAIASFDEIGGYGNDQMNKKLEAYADLINNMSNKYSIDAEGLAEAIRLSAGTLTEANTTIEQAATMFATANKYYNDPKYLGNTAKVGSLRLRATTGDEDAIKELSEMGEDIEEVTALTGKLRKELLKLTGVDIMVDNNTFKSYYDQLYEISQVIDELDDTTSAKVLEMLFGKNRAAAGESLLSGMQESEKAYADAINSAGSATAEYEVWMQSAEAATQRFSNSLTEMYQSIINGNTVRDLANIGSSVVDFANKWGILEGAVKGYLALKVGTAITSGTMAFVSATKQVEQYGKALQMVNNIPNGNLAEKYNALRDIAQATSSLTEKQLKQVLASEKLSYQDRIRILQIQGMNKEIALQKLAEMKLTQVTNAQTLANKAQTVSTFNLKSAMIGLKSTIQGVFLSNPVGITLMGLSVGFSALTSAISNHNQKLEETKQKNLEASEKAVEHAKSLKDLYTEYSRLSSIQERTASQEEEFKNVVEDITKKLGDKAKALEGLTIGTNEYAEALANLTKEELQSSAVEATIGRKIAEEDLQKDVWSDLKGSKVTIDSNSKGKALSDEAQKAVDIVADSLKEFETINRTWNNLSWDITSDSPEEALEYYNALVKAREALVLVSEDDESLLETEVYKDLNSAITTMSDSLEEYIAKRYEEEKLNYMAQNGIPQTVEEYHAMKSAMDKIAGTSEGLKSKFNDLLTADFSGLATSIGSVAESGEHLADSISSFNIESFSNTIQSYEDGYKRLTEVQEEWNEAKSLSAETFADLQESGLLEYLDFTSEGLTINKDKLLENAQASKDKAVADLHAAMMSDMLQIALGNVDSVSEEAKTVIAQLGDNTETAGQQALNSVSEWATLGATISNVMAQARGEDRGFNGVSDEQKEQMESVYNYYTDMAEKVSAIDITVPTRTASASKAGKSAADAYVDAFEKELKSLQSLRDNGKVSEKEYLDRLRELYTKYFKDRKEYLDEFKKYEAEYLKGMKSLYDSALPGITSILSDKIDDLNDARDEEIEKLEEVRDKAVDAIQEQIDAKKSEIEAIQKASKQRQNELNLQEKQFALAQKMNQKSELAFVDGQMIYRPNEQGIRDAREELTQAEEEIEISRIESEIDSLEIQLKGVEKYYDSLIEKKNAYYNQEIKFLEQQKEMWDDFSNTLEMAEIIEPLKTLGISMEDILSGNTAVLNNFKDNYLAICAAINSGNEDYLNELSQSSGKSVAELQAMAEKFKTTGSLISELSNTASTASTSIKDTASAVGEMNTNSEGLDTKLGNISSALNSIPTSEKIGGLSSEFINLAEAIGKVATALGISTEDSVGGLLGALTSLSTLTLGDEETGIIAQFNALKTAVDAVTSSITGGGETSSDAMSGTTTGKQEASNTEGQSGLTGAITEIGTTTDETLGVGGESEGGESDEGEGVLGKFAKFKSAVDEVTKAIGTGEEESDEESTSLISALQKHYETAEETLPQVKGFFEELLVSITACVEKLKELGNGISSLGSGGIPVEPNAKGTSYAKKGLHLVGEEKSELIEDTKGNLSLATQPTLLNMKGGEKVYNGEETEKIMSYDAYMSLTPESKKGYDLLARVGKVKSKENPDGTITLPDGSVLRPLRQGDKAYEYQQKFEAYLAKNPNFLYPTQNAWSRQMDGMINSLKNTQVVNNNRAQTQNLTQNINVTLPNVTNETGFKNFEREMKGYQNYARQQCSITR